MLCCALRDVLFTSQHPNSTSTAPAVSLPQIKRFADHGIKVSLLQLSTAEP
jgi:hypothetical protein